MITIEITERTPAAEFCCVVVLVPRVVLDLVVIFVRIEIIVLRTVNGDVD